MIKTIHILSYAVLLAGLISCNNGASYEKTDIEGWHRISPGGAFSIAAPEDVKYVPRKGIDSFVGELIGDSIALSFDHGAYSDPLIPTPKEYLDSKLWLSAEIIPQVHIVCWTKDSTANYPAENQFTIVKLEKDSASEFRYHVQFKYQDSIWNYDFDYPKEYQKYEFEVDTIDHWYVKRVYPVVQARGMMGVYIENTKGSKDWPHCPKLCLTFQGEQRSDEYKIEILRSVRMK